MRTRELLVVLTAVILGSLGFARPAACKTVDDIAVVVDQEAVTRGELEESIQAFFLSQRLKPAQPGTPAYQAAKKDVVEGFVREVLLAEEADRQKVEVTDGEIDHEVNSEIENMKKGFSTEQEFTDELKKEGITVDDLRLDVHDKLLRRIKANRVLRMKQQDLPGSAVVTDTEARQFFDEHPLDYEQVKFSIILFRVPPKSKPEYVKEVETQAQGLLKELKGGADFAAYAKKYSEDQGSAEKGGAVGTVYRSEMEPKLAKGVFSIPEKGMGVVKAVDGIYIVKVDFKGKADFALVSPEIKDHLRKNKQESGLKDWIEGLKKNAYIVEDGKVVSASATNDTLKETKTEEDATASTTSTKSPKTPGSNSGTTAISKGEAAEASSEKKHLFPSLPEGGSLILYVGGEGFSYGTQDLANYYGSAVSTSQGFPFGFGVDGGIELALDPTFQVGILVEALQKFGENATDASGYKETWSASLLAPSLSAKLLIPMDESTNFMISASGGYYLLTGGGVTISGAGVTENANLGASNFGGKAGGAIEFLLDSHRNTALDLGIEYRYLKLSPLTTSVSSTGPVPFASPLANNDGTPAVIDLSGVVVNVNVRFFLGKD